MRRMHPTKKGSLVYFHRSMVVNSGYIPSDYITKINKAKLTIAKEYQILDRLSKSLKTDNVDPTIFDDELAHIHVLHLEDDTEDI